MKVILIKPIPAPRPRFSRYGTYNPEDYTIYKLALGILIKKHHKKVIDIPLRLTIDFYLPIPKMSKKKTLEHEGVYHYKKPDLDNLVKAFKDSANAIIYKDDNIVSSIIANKYYSEEPRIEYNIEEL